MTKLKIKGSSLYIVDESSGEHINGYVGIFQKYFKNATHHLSNSHRINMDTILFYSYFPSDVNCSDCNNIPTQLNIPKKVKEGVGEAFYDFKRMDMPCGNVERIHYGSKFVGFYCKKHNILSLSDIVHTPGNERHLTAIIEAMLENDLLRILESSPTKKTISLGTDPEMESVVDGNVVSAAGLIQLSNREKVYISHDGHTQPQRELRPDPGATPEELVENLKDLIKISSFFGEDLSVLGKTCPLGGHIHIGNASPSKELVQVLDYFLFPFNEFSSKERIKSKYGKPGDVRLQPHGFEYRTPPPAWLLTPNLALKTLQLTKLIVENIINNIDVNISNNFEWDEYKENLSSLGFDNEWIGEFENEIRWAKSHLHTPLAKTWGVEVPKEYQIKKNYTYIPKSPPPRSMEAPIGATLRRNFPFITQVREIRDEEIDPRTGTPEEYL